MLPGFLRNFRWIKCKRTVNIPVWLSVVLGFALVLCIGQLFVQSKGECLFIRAFGVHCPFCGGSSAVKALLRLDVIDAVRTNPFVIFIFMTAVCYILVRVLFARTIYLRLNRMGAWVCFGLFFMSLLLNWIYLFYCRT